VIQVVLILKAPVGRRRLILKSMSVPSI
jgi:hypothetical protein